MSKFRKLLNSELGRISSNEYSSAEKMPVTIVLDNVRSQHNIGAAFRSTDAFAAERIILCGICATPPSAEIHKSALGAENTIPWEYFEDSTDAVNSLKEEGYEIISVEQTENSTLLNNIKPVIDKSTPLSLEMR